MAPEVATLRLSEVVTLRLPEVTTLRFFKVTTLKGGSDDDTKMTTLEVATLSLSIRNANSDMSIIYLLRFGSTSLFPRPF